MTCAAPLAELVWQGGGGRAALLVAALVVALIFGLATLYVPQTTRVRWRWRVALLALRAAALVALAASLLQPTLMRPPRPDERGAVVVLVDRSHSMATRDDRQHRVGQTVALADGMGLIPAGLRSSGDEWVAAAARATGAFDELSAAQGRLSFARISGRDATAAEEEYHAAAARVAGELAALVARRGGLDAQSPLGRAIGSLRARLDRWNAAARGEEALPPLRAALDAVADAAGSFQADADDRLYQHDPRVRAACDHLAALDRIGLVDEALTAPGTGLLSNLPTGAPLYGFAVGGDGVEPLPLRRQGQPVRRIALEADAAGGDLAAAVRTALDSLRGAPVRAAVLFSDGREPVTTASRRPDVAAPLGVPVFAVSPAPLPREGGGGTARDLSIEELSVPAAVFAGEPFRVAGRVFGLGFGNGTPIDVRCEVGTPAVAPPVPLAPVPGAWAVALAALEWPPTVPADKPDPILRNGVADVRVDVRIDDPGPQRVALRLRPNRDEATADNNVSERWVKVLPRPTRVALLADAPTWDWRLVRDALSARPGFDVRSASLDGGALQWPPDDLTSQDAIVLFDVAAASLGAAQRAALRRFVTDRGGLLVITAGPAHAPAEFVAEAELRDLLPFAAAPPRGNAEWHTWSGADPAYGFVGAVRLADTPDADALAWPSIPPVFRYVALPPLRPAATPLLRERDRGDVVAAQMPVGAGRVAFVGLDETWRWAQQRLGDDEDAARRFWVTLIRNGAEPPYAAVSGPLSLDVDRAAVAPGEPVGVRVKAGSPGAKVSLRVTRGAAVVRSIELPPTDVAGRTVARLAGLPYGSYRVEAAVGSGPSAQRIEYPLQVVAHYEAELENPAAARDNLERLVTSTGGRLLPMEQVRQLPALLAATGSEVKAVPVRLWDSTYLFVFVVACLSAEWALRKRIGLA